MRRLAILALLVLALAGAAAAQGSGEDAARQIARWDEVAAETEAQLAKPALGATTLERLRAGMLAQRQAAQLLRDQLAGRALPLRAQLDALGPAPAEGAVEAEEIARRRSELVAAIAAADAPVKAAEAAFRRADTLLQALDARLKERFRAELLLRQPSPLNPAVWPEAAGDLSRQAAQALRDGASGIGRAGPEFWPGLLVAALGLFVILGVRGRVLDWFRHRLAPDPGGPGGIGRQVWAGAGLLLAALVLPAAGWFLMLGGLRAGGLANGVAASYLRDATGLALSLIAASWLAVTLFGAGVASRELLPLAERKRRQAVQATLVLGFVTGLDAFLVAGSSAAWLSNGTLAVLNLALVATGALALWRLATALTPEDRAEREAEHEGEEAEPPGATLGETVLHAVVRLARLLAVTAPLLAALGFYAASRFAFYPVVLTGAVLGAWVVLVALVQAGTAAVLADADATKPAALRLLPVAAGFVLACVAIPVVALVWGARRSDLGEAWYLVTTGIPIGETRVSPLDFAAFALVFLAGYTATRIVQRLLRNTVLPQTGLDPGGRSALVSLLGYVGIVLAAIAAIGATGLDLSSLAIVAGALSVGLGFGLQNVVSNFVSGLILLIERPVKDGDWVKVGEVEGIVKRISVRATAVQTFDRAVVIIPNADLITTPVLNRTHSSNIGRVIVKVGVAYGSDTRRVETVLREVAASCDLLLRRPAPIIVFRGFGESALDFEIIGFLRDVNTILAATTFLNHGMAERLAAEGITIPFPQRDLNLRETGPLAEALDRLAAAVAGARSPGPETNP